MALQALLVDVGEGDVAAIQDIDSARPHNLKSPASDEDSGVLIESRLQEEG